MIFQIGSLYVITAAHCVEKDEAANVRIETEVQDTRNPDDRRTYKVESILVYPDYSVLKNPGEGLSIDHDIALIKLQNPVTSTNFAQPINLSDDENISGTTGILVGWGADGYIGWGSEGSYTYELNKAEMPIQSNEDCMEMLNTVGKKKYKNGRIFHIQKGHLCAGHHHGGIDGCQVSYSNCSWLQCPKFPLFCQVLVMHNIFF